VRTVDERECPDCNGEGEHANGESCARCDGTGELDDDDNGERLANASSDSRRTLDVDAMSAAHQQNMSRIYDQIALDVSQRWRRDK
jgi:DnaJ-class molecular chaperone